MKNITKLLLTVQLILLLSSCNIIEFDRTVTIFNKTGSTIKNLYIITESDFPDLSPYNNDEEFFTYCDGLYTDQLLDITMPHNGNVVVNLETINPNTSDFVIVSYDDYDITIRHFTDSEEFITLEPEDHYDFFPEIGVFTP